MSESKTAPVRALMETDEARYPEAMASSEAVMAAYETFGCPCPDCHGLLGKLAGEWKVEADYALDRGMPRMKGAGAAEIRLLFGGRYLCVELFHESEHLMYKVHCLYAYDRFAQRFAATWATNMNTALMQCLGDWDPETRVLGLTGEFAHPVTGDMLAMGVDLALPEGFEGGVDSFEWILSLPDEETDEMIPQVNLKLTRAGRDSEEASSPELEKAASA